MSSTEIAARAVTLPGSSTIPTETFVPAVTVIIPAHDEEQAIRPTLNHLLHQDFDGPLRIVVVPNGSTPADRLTVTIYHHGIKVCELAWCVFDETP